MVELREYQLDGVTRIREAFRVFRAVLYVLATGGGKTRIFSYIAQSAAARGKRIVVLCHRIELIDQVVEALRELGVEPDIVAAGYDRRPSAIIVASVFTLVRRLNRIQAPDLIIADEAHHCANGNTWATILSAWPRARILGVTATAVRSDSKGLGETFQTLICGPALSWLTEHGYLAPARIYAPPLVDTSGLHTRAGEYITSELERRVDVPSITGDAINEWRTRGQGRPALAFAVSVRHAHDLANQFRAAGVSALSFSGQTDRALRRQIVADFRRGAISVLCQCDLANEGFDVPGAHVGLMLRPTQSLGLWRQQVGRILRPCEGKSDAIILDFCGNTLKHGRPIDEPEWALTYDEESRRKQQPAASCRVCPHCWAANRSGARVCTECGVPFPIQSREVDQREGELVELTAESIAKKRERQTQGMAKTLEDLIRIEKRKRYKPGWALRVFNAREAKRTAKEAAETPSDAQLLVNLGGMIR